MTMVPQAFSPRLDAGLRSPPGSVSRVALAAPIPGGALSAQTPGRVGLSSPMPGPSRGALSPNGPLSPRMLGPSRYPCHDGRPHSRCASLSMSPRHSRIATPSPSRYPSASLNGSLRGSRSSLGALGGSRSSLGGSRGGVSSLAMRSNMPTCPQRMPPQGSLRVGPPRRCRSPVAAASQSCPDAVPLACTSAASRDVPTIASAEKSCPEENEEYNEDGVDLSTAPSRLIVPPNLHSMSRQSSLTSLANRLQSISGGSLTSKTGGSLTSRVGGSLTSKVGGSLTAKAGGSLTSKIPSAAPPEKHPRKSQMPSRHDLAVVEEEARRALEEARVELLETRNQLDDAWELEKEVDLLDGLLQTAAEAENVLLDELLETAAEAVSMEVSQPISKIRFVEKQETRPHGGVRDALQVLDDGNGSTPVVRCEDGLLTHRSSKSSPGYRSVGTPRRLRDSFDAVRMPACQCGHIFLVGEQICRNCGAMHSEMADMEALAEEARAISEPLREDKLGFE